MSRNCRALTRSCSGLVAMALLGLGAAGLAAERVRVPGTQVSLEPPPGYSASKRFPGFESVEHQASIMVTEMPAPAQEMAKGMTKERLAAGGMTLLASKPAKVDGRDASLLHVGQAAAGVEYRKWMLVTGNEKTSILVVGTFPATSAEEVSAAIKRSVLSVSWSAAALADPLEGLPFRVTPTAKLKLAGRVGHNLMLTESGAVGKNQPTDPLLIVGMSVSPVRITNLRQYSEERVRKTAQVKGIRNVVGKPARLGSIAAYEIVAHAADAKTGAALCMYQVLAPCAGGYYLVVGMAGADRAAEMLPEFRRVTASFRDKAASRSER